MIKSQKGAIDLAVAVVLVLVAIIIASIGYVTYNTRNQKIDTDKIIKKYQDLPGQISVEEIKIKTGVDPFARYQDAPFELITSQGHYVLRTFFENPTNPTKGIIYDDKLLNIKPERIKEFSLSNNGLHYIYIIQKEIIDKQSNTSIDELYVDSNKITEGFSMREPKVSDDGNNYFYVQDTIESGQNITPESNSVSLIKNGNEILKNHNFIDLLSISNDGSTYLARVTSTKYPKTDLVLNGKTVYSGSPKKILDDIDIVLSPNGQHYGWVEITISSDEGAGHTLEKKLFIDSREVFNSDQSNVSESNLLQLSNKGDFIFCASRINYSDYCRPSNLYLNNQVINKDYEQATYMDKESGNYISYNGPWESSDGKEIASYAINLKPQHKEILSDTPNTIFEFSQDTLYYYNIQE